MCCIPIESAEFRPREAAVDAIGSGSHTSFRCVRFLILVLLQRRERRRHFSLSVRIRNRRHCRFVQRGRTAQQPARARLDIVCVSDPILSMCFEHWASVQLSNCLLLAVVPCTLALGSPVRSFTAVQGWFKSVQEWFRAVQDGSAVHRKS